MNIKNHTIEELEKIAQDIRERILEVVSRNGGHLSSTLGAVDLIIAMHYVFDAASDPFIFDVSHQAYAHKLLTDRWEAFETLRQFEGVCGYTKPTESPYDYYVAGHSSTSISLGVGAAKAIALKGEKRLPVAFIGDGSMSAGMVYEALNELGEHKYPMVIILNDNEMSIAKPIGAISRILSQAMASPFYQRFKRKTEQLLEHLPEGAHYVARRLEEGLRMLTPGLLFEEMGLEYIGPIDGHNIKELITTLELAKNMGKPVIVHAQTLKGKGYEIAEGQHEHWHGVGPFDVNDGIVAKKATQKNATQVYSDALLALAHENSHIVGVTAAMPSGTGMSALMEAFPHRFWDVAIAEQHAVTSMGAMAKEGFKPFVAIYSTFLQRAYDQIIHDVCLMNLPVVFAIDRAGIVGEDGETHQGAFDISFLRAIPTMTLFAPRDEATLIDAVRFAASMPTPCAFRYPRGVLATPVVFETASFELGKAQMLVEHDGDALLIGYGAGVGRALAVNALLQKPLSVLDLRFVKPLDEAMLLEAAQRYTTWYVLSDSAAMGGVGSAIMEFLQAHGITGIGVVSFEYSDAFITHGATALVEASLGLSPQHIAQKIEGR